MVKDLIRHYLDHPRRTWITWGAALAVGLVFALPAWDSLSDARETSAEMKSELRGTTLSVSNLELMQTRLRDVSTGPDAFDQLIDLERTDQLRDRVTKVVHQMDCQIRRLTVSDPARRNWADHDDPFATTVPEGAEKSNYSLETRQLSVVVDGNLSQLSKLTIALTQLDRFAVPTEMTLRRETVNGHLRLDVNISLFNLVETND